MLRLERVCAGYGRAPVLQQVDLRVDRGETVALLGPNGAGKSTLLAAITGTLAQREGAIYLDSENIAREPSHRIVARGVALVPEGRLVFAPFSVEDNLRLGAVRLAGGRAALRERYAYVFRLFPRLAERRSQAAGTLSGGEQQMLAIGRALMSAPRLLLLDEPFLGLAPLVVSEIRRSLEELRAAGLTLLMVEQKLDIALPFAQRAYVLIKGRVVLEDSTGNLRRRADLSDLYFSLATSASSARSMP
jgi:branched-chain amino acid transport system ATP-binding protein